MTLVILSHYHYLLLIFYMAFGRQSTLIPAAARKLKLGVKKTGVRSEDQQNNRSRQSAVKSPPNTILSNFSENL